MKNHVLIDYLNKECDAKLPDSAVVYEHLTCMNGEVKVVVDVDPDDLLGELRTCTVCLVDLLNFTYQGQGDDTI